MQCSKCGKSLEQGAKFCPYCGQKTEKRCFVCGEVIADTAKFCPFCGKLADEDKMVLEETNKSEYPENKFVIKKDKIEKDGIKEKNNSDDGIFSVIQLIIFVIMVVIFFRHFDWIEGIFKPRPVPTLRDNISPPSGKIENEFEKFTDLGDEEYIQVGNLDVFLPIKVNEFEKYV